MLDFHTRMEIQNSSSSQAKLNYMVLSEEESQEHTRHDSNGFGGSKGYLNGHPCESKRPRRLVLKSNWSELANGGISKAECSNTACSTIPEGSQTVDRSLDDVRPPDIEGLVQTEAR